MSLIWCKLERFHKRELLRRLFSVWQLYRMIISDQPFSGQSRSNCHRYRNLLQSELWQSRMTSSPHLPGLQKVGKNKSISRQHVWGHCSVDYSNKLYHQGFYRQKITKMTKRTAADIEKVQRQNRQRSFRQEGSGYVPVDFQAKKFHIITPRLVFMKGRRPRLCHHLIPGIRMTAKAKKTIR